MAKSAIAFKSFNPYECRFPDRRVVLFELLQLIKLLRAEGYSVQVLPDDGTRLNWRQENGLRQLLQDPIILLCISIPLNVLTSLLATIAWENTGRWKTRRSAPIFIDIPSGKEKGLYRTNGKQVMQDVPAQTDERREWELSYAKTRSIPPPQEEFPEPILYEHTDRIVGWGRLSTDEVGLKVAARISDPGIRMKLDSGELQGFSFGALIYDSECSVCGKQYVNCNHIAGRTYGQVECIATIKGADLAEISVVAQPANPYARARRVE